MALITSGRGLVTWHIELFTKLSMPPPVATLLGHTTFSGCVKDWSGQALHESSHPSEDPPSLTNPETSVLVTRVVPKTPTGSGVTVVDTSRT